MVGAAVRIGPQKSEDVADGGDKPRERAVPQSGIATVVAWGPSGS